jgi:hypothetical protein
MSYEQWHLGAIGRSLQTLAFRHCVGNRLFDQRRYARSDAFKRLLDVKMVRRGENDAVRPYFFEEFAKRAIKWNAGLGGDFGGSRSRVDEGGQLTALTLLDQLDMTPPNGARAGNGELNLSHDRSAFP